MACAVDAEGDDTRDGGDGDGDGGGVGGRRRSRGRGMRACT
jgi:hypothetical protein